MNKLVGKRNRNANNTKLTGLDPGIGWLDQIETWIVHQIQQIFYPRFNYIALFFRWLVTDAGISTLSPALVWMTTPEKAMICLFAFTFSEFLNAMAKWCWQRPRPFWLQVQNNLIVNIQGSWETDFSFPSSHSQIISAFIASILLYYDLSFGVQVFLVILVLFMGTARVYLGVHFPFDVLVGWASGLIVPLVIQHIDLVMWFAKLSEHTKICLAFVVPIGLFSILYCIRATIPDVPEHVVQQWEKNAHLTEKVVSNKRISPRSLAKYYFPFCSVGGGILGTSLAMTDKNLLFLFEECSFADLPSTIPRYLFGLLVIVAVLFPSLFLLPKNLDSPLIPAAKKNSKDKPKSVLKVRKLLVVVIPVVASFFAGIWINYGSAKAADVFFGLRCAPLPPLSYMTDLSDEINGCRLNSNTSRIDYPVEIRPVKSIADIQAVIQEAKSIKKCVRVVGAAHSQQMQQDLDLILPEAIFISLNGELASKYEWDSAMQLITVGAGMYLGSNPERGIKWEQSFIKRLWDDGFSFSSLPGVVFQTIGGAFATGTKGGSSKYSWYDNLEAIKYVNGKGEVKLVSRSDPKTREAFKAASVSLGLTGISVELTFRPVKRYCVRREFKMLGRQFSSIKSEARSQEILASTKMMLRELTNHNEYGRIAVLPLHDAHDAAFFRPAFVMKDLISEAMLMNRTKDNTDNYCGNLAPDEHFESFGKAYFPYENQLFISLFGALISQPSCLENVPEVFRRSKSVHELRTIGLKLPQIEVSVLRCYQQLKKTSINKIRIHGVPWQLALPCFGGNGVSDAQLDYGELNSYRGPLVTPYFYDLATDQSYLSRLFPVEQVELHFPIENPGDDIHVVKTFLEEILENPGAHEAGTKFTEIYYAPANDFYLGYKQKAIRINSFMDRRASNYYEYFTKVWEVFDRAGIKFQFHFGKFLPNRPEHQQILRRGLAAIGEDLEKFKRQVEIDDPDEVFMTTYWKQIFWTQV